MKIHKPIPFVKATACGNDFLVIEEDHGAGDLAELTREMCDRHEGVGADGVEWISAAGAASCAARLLNADGSPAEISGNGTRCVAAYLCSQGGHDAVTILTGAGAKPCVLTSRSGNRYEFQTAMGQPEVGHLLSLVLSGGEVAGVRISMGNPHYVIFVEQFPAAWQAQAAQIQASGMFTAGINVEYVLAPGHGELEVRFFERGAGETRSSGTGSCAAAVAAIAGGRARSPVAVRAPGGTQNVRWEDQVYLQGTARLICQGEFWPK